MPLLIILERERGGGRERERERERKQTVNIARIISERKSKAHYMTYSKESE